MPIGGCNKNTHHPPLAMAMDGWRLAVGSWQWAVGCGQYVVANFFFYKCMLTFHSSNLPIVYLLIFKVKQDSLGYDKMKERKQRMRNIKILLNT